MRTMGISTLAILVALGCGDGGESGDPGGGVRTEGPPIVVGDTPEATFLAMKDAVVREEYGALLDLFYPSVREQQLEQFREAKKREDFARKTEEFAKEAGLPADELMNMSAEELVLVSLEIRFSKKPGARERYTKATVKKTDIDGDKAIVHFESDGEAHNTTFVMHEGKWYYHPWP